MSDPFRPQHQPAQGIYDALQAEAAQRKSRELDVWIKEERQAVWRAARDYAQQHGLPILTLEEIENAERSAMGHTDYAAKWAYGVSERMGATPVFAR